MKKAVIKIYRKGEMCIEKIISCGDERRIYEYAYGR